MPQLRLVVLATQDRLAYGPTFESALNALFGGGSSSTTAVAAITQAAPAPRGPAAAATPETAGDLNTLIADAAKDLANYQRLTSEGKLGEAGQRLEDLKRKLEELQKRRR